MIKEKLKEAFLSHADGHIKKHVANVEVLLNNPTGIGEHGDIISEIEKERWTITLSSRKGSQSLKEYERTIEKNKIIEICNDNFIKKILEIIPSSEVISIQELENDKLMKREENE